MNELQANNWLSAAKATFVKAVGDVQWYRLPDGSWVGKRKYPTGVVELRQAASCGC